MFDSRQRGGLFSSLPCPDGPPYPSSPTTMGTEERRAYYQRMQRHERGDGNSLQWRVKLRTHLPCRLIALMRSFSYTPHRSCRQTLSGPWRQKKVKGLFCLMLPDFRKHIVFGKLSRLRPFVLVRATCRWKWVRSTGGIVLTGESRSARIKAYSSATLSTTNFTSWDS
jgi:hypothetical protein